MTDLVYAFCIEGMNADERRRFDDKLLPPGEAQRRRRAESARGEKQLQAMLGGPV